MNTHVKVDIETASDLWKDGSSINVIAVKYGVSRQTVAGIMYRNRELFPKRNRQALAISKSTKVRRARSIHKDRMEAAKREAEEFDAGTSPLLQIDVSDEERLATGKELHDLGVHECKWALNHGGPFLFCADATQGERYCLHHSIRAYRRRGAYERTSRSRGDLCGIRFEVVPANVMPGNGQTRAIATLDRIRNRHGEAHARFVVMTLSETANNRAFIDETSLWVIIDMVRAAAKNYLDLVDNNVSAWFAFFDGLPLGWLQFWALDLDGVISKRHALGGMIYERMRRRFGALAVQPDLLDDRRGAA